MGASTWIEFVDMKHSPRRERYDPVSQPPVSRNKRLVMDRPYTILWASPNLSSISAGFRPSRSLDFGQQAFEHERGMQRLHQHWHARVKAGHFAWQVHAGVNNEREALAGQACRDRR